MGCRYKIYKPGVVLCAEPDVTTANDERPKIIRCEEHCTTDLCNDYISDTTIFPTTNYHVDIH